LPAFNSDHDSIITDEAPDKANNIAVIAESVVVGDLLNSAASGDE
jgi:hypothetical protein